MTADIRFDLEELVRPDGRTPRDRIPPRVNHDHEPVLLGGPYERPVFPRMVEGTEPDFRQPHAGPAELPEILRLKRGFENHRPPVHPHPPGTDVVVGMGGRYGKGFDPFAITRSPRGVKLPRGDAAGDSAVHVTIKKPHRFLAGRVIPQHHVAVRVDQSGQSRRPPGVDHDVGVLPG